MRNKRLRLLAILLVPFLCLAAFLVEEHFRGKISLARFKRELAAQGKKLDPRDFVHIAKPEENGAPEILGAAGHLKKGAGVPDSYPPRMRMVPSGRAIDGSRQDYWVNDKTTNRWSEVAADMKQNEEILQAIRVALRKPVLNNNLDLSQGFIISFNHILNCKMLANWFSSATELALHEGKNQEALDWVIDETELNRLLAEDYMAISELVRYAMTAIAAVDTWEALQRDEWTDAELARLQQCWESQTFLSALPRSLEGEMAFESASFELCRRSNKDSAALIFGMANFMGSDAQPAWERVVQELPGGSWFVEFLKNQVYSRIWRFAWLDQDERRSLGFGERLCAIVREAAKTGSLADAQPKADQLALEAEPTSRFDQLRFPGPNSIATLSRVISRSMKLETQRSMILCSIALKRAWLSEHKFPASLAQLVPKVLSKVPVDYMDGIPLRYRTESDSMFILYSIGDDFRDDGGDASLRKGKSNLHDFWSRNDFVWPAPASPEEVAEDLEKSISGQH